MKLANEKMNNRKPPFKGILILILITSCGGPRADAVPANFARVSLEGADIMENECVPHAYDGEFDRLSIEVAFLDAVLREQTKNAALVRGTPNPNGILVTKTRFGTL